MQRMRKTSILGAALASAFLVLGCHHERPETPTAVKHDTETVIEKTGEGVERAGEKTEKAGEKIQRKMEEKKEQP